MKRSRLTNLALKLTENRFIAPLRDRFTKTPSLLIYSSGMTITPQEFASLFVFLSIVSTALLAVAMAIALFLLPMPPLVLLLILGIPPLFLMAHALRPYFAVSRRKAGCERELPFVATFLTMAAAAAISIPHAISSLARLRSFNFFSKEAQRIEKVRRLYALSPSDAVMFEAKIHPSEHVRSMLFSAIAAQKSGESLFLTMKDEMVKSFSLTLSRLKVLSDKFSLVASTQMIVYIIIPMAMITLGIMFSGIINIYSLFFICIGLPVAFTPLLTYVIDSYYPKELTEPVDLRYFALSLAFIPASALLYALFHANPPLPLHYVLALTLLSTTVPIAMYYSSLRTKTKAILSTLPSFSRSVAEEVKRGLSPAQAIELLSRTRFYNKPFSSIISRLTAHIRIGRTISQAIENIKMPWIAKAYFELLDYAEQIGADPRAMDALSDLINSIHTSMNELRSQTQLFKFSCIINSVILPFSVAIVVEVVVKLFSSSILAIPLTASLPLGLSFIAVESIPTLALIAYSGVILNAYLLGLLGGKASMGGSIADGLSIAAVCVAIASLTLFFLVELHLLSSLLSF